MDTIEAPASGRTGLPGPRPAGPWHLMWSRLSWPIVALWRKGRNRWLLARGVRRPRRWWRPRTWPETVIYSILSAVYLLWIVRGIWSKGPWGFLGPVANWLDTHGLQPALTALGLSSATVAAAVWFLAWRFRRARRYYLHKARRNATDLVKPGSIIGEVVGRDQLCDALMSDLRDRKRRRPHVIVGSIGVGKTALLVRLTERLARKGAIPVVLQLQDLKDKDCDLDFSVLAKQRFMDEVRERVSPSEAEKVWQRLRYRNDSVVVLADGLEDALTGRSDRANRIRKAIADADNEKLPLALASRPQESLQAVRAAHTVLEPLSEEAALRYITANSGWRSDKQRLDWVVEAANVAESPIYLNIAKDLESRSLLEPIVGGGGDKLADPRDQDEWALRYDLLEAWIQALIGGYLYPEQSLSYYGRLMTVEYLSALACAALRENSTRVAYEALAEPDNEEPKAGNAGMFRTLLLTELYEREQRAGAKGKAVIDVRLAGSWGSRLGLVEEQGDGVKFQHSVLQAYLASRYLKPLVRYRAAAGDPDNDACDYFKQALTHPCRELDMALVFYSRSPDALIGCRSEDQLQGKEDGDKRCPIYVAREILWKEANAVLESMEKEDSHGDQGRLTDEIEQDPRIRALEMYSAALDIDSFHHKPEHRDIVMEIRDHWEHLQEYNERKLDPTKKALVRRMGAAARLVSGRNDLPSAFRSAAGSPTAYRYMFAMACLERSYSVRFTIAQEIGEGGDDAFLAIWPYLQLERTREADDDAAKQRFAINEEITKFVDEAAYSLQANLKPADPSPTASEPESRPDDARPASAPGTTRTERLLRKERQQRLREKRQLQEEVEQKEREQNERRRRSDITQVWLAPMLVRSCTLTHHQGTPYELLSHWMKDERLDWTKEEKLDRGLQVALAQGFKQAANHRILPAEPSAARDFLSEQAWEMLKRTRYWFARLTLIHALTLWALPDDVAQRQPRYGHGSDPREQVKRWLERLDPDGRKHPVRDENPLVRAAGKLARQALQTRRPDRFLWIDEAGVTGQIGSETSSPREPRLHNLWVPPSTGWSSLDPAAQQLLADVLVLLILTEERGDRVEDELARLERVDRSTPPMLPRCLTKDRSPLEPMRSLVREAPRSLPGSNCADGCPFELCPYPPKGPECRTELNELFCIHQRAKLNGLQPQAWRFFKFRRRAPWQRHVPVANLRRFWDEMGARARDRTPEEAFGGPLSRR